MARNGASLAWLLLFAVFVGASALVGCQGGAKTSDRDVVIIDHKEFDALVKDRRAQAVVVDPRPVSRFEQGHLPGAINIPIDSLRAGDARLAEAQRIIVYAGGPHDVLSNAAAKKLLTLGYKNVYDFRGGLRLWEAEGRTVVGGE